jgi:hypothetical protein
MLSLLLLPNLRPPEFKFWTEVQRLLITQHGLSEEEAQRGIEDYLRRLRQHEVGDLVYHQGCDRAACTLAGAIRQGGFKEPME